MRFKEAYEGWNAGRLTQCDAAQILGMCERSFRRHLSRFEADGLVVSFIKTITNQATWYQRVECFTPLARQGAEAPSGAQL